MNTATARKIIEIQEKAMRDEQYLQLMEEYQGRNRCLLEELETMTETQQSAVLNYIGLCAEMHAKLLEIGQET